MKKLMFVLSILSISIACGPSDPNKSAVTGKDVSLSSEVLPGKMVKIRNFQIDLDKLNSEKPGLLAAARENEACDAFDRFGSYEDLQMRYNRLVSEDRPDEVGDKIDDAVRSAGQKMADAGYAQMKTGKSLECGPEMKETLMVEQFVNVMNKYGSSMEGVNFEPKVVRSAYLRAIKPEIQSALADLKDNASLSDNKSTAKYTLEKYMGGEWHFTLDELGVPSDLRRKLDL